MIEGTTIIIIVGTFLLAGSVKGVIGLGLPTVSLGILTAALDLTTAMAMLLIPSFITNVWQALVGGNGIILVRRIWPFLLLATATIWFGTFALTSINPLYLTILLGVLLVTYASFHLLGASFSISKQNEKWVGPLFGMANGIFTGMTGSFVVPGVMFLQSIGLPRDMLIQAMGMLFALSTIGLGIALKTSALLSMELVSKSALSVVPAIIGMVIGQRIRKSLPETLFRKLFFISIFVLGLFIIAKAAISL